MDEADREFWVEQLKKTYFGDANLNGEFNSSDMVAVFAAGQYEDALSGNSSWATGDWDGNGEFQSGDMVVAFQAGGYEKGLRDGEVAVPEPGALRTAVDCGDRPADSVVVQRGRADSLLPFRLRESCCGIEDGDPRVAICLIVRAGRSPPFDSPASR